MAVVEIKKVFLDETDSIDVGKIKHDINTMADRCVLYAQILDQIMRIVKAQSYLEPVRYQDIPGALRVLLDKNASSPDQTS